MGRDKAWLKLAGRPMIEHVIRALEPVTEHISIIANSPEYEQLGYPVFGDSQVGIGPLEAIRTALSNAQASRVVLVGCDLPFVTSELFKFLLSFRGAYHAAVPMDADEKLEPLCAIYCIEAVSAVTDLIDKGERKTSLLFDRVATRFVAFDELRDLTGSELFFENVNSPQDYARAIEIARRLRGA